MKYFDVSLAKVKSLSLSVGNRRKHKHKPCEKKRQSWDGNKFLLSVYEIYCGF